MCDIDSLDVVSTAAPTPSPTPETAAAPAWVRPTFRVLAFAEAVSWAALLTTMFFKWIVQADPHSGIEGGVPVSGPIHGALFVAYCLICVIAWRTFRWTPKTLVIALVAAIPPFCTAWFEVSADRRGLLGAPASAAADAPGR